MLARDPCWPVRRLMGLATSTMSAPRTPAGSGHDGSMMIGPDVLIAEFGDAAGKAAIRGWPCSLRFEQRPARHQKPELPPGEGAVSYSLSAPLTAPLHPAARARSSKSARLDRATGDASVARTTTRQLQRFPPSPRAFSPTRSCGRGWASTT